jgi:hypothetical protein
MSEEMIAALAAPASSTGLTSSIPIPPMATIGTGETPHALLSSRKPTVGDAFALVDVP